VTIVDVRNVSKRTIAILTENGRVFMWRHIKCFFGFHSWEYDAFYNDEWFACINCDEIKREKNNVEED